MRRSKLFPRREVHVDAVRFLELAREAVSDGGIAAAKAAIAAYGGELFPLDRYEPWAEQHRLHLGHLHVELLHQAEDWHQVISADPSSETAHLALVHRHAERGDHTAALRQLDRLDRVMREELGLPPSRQAREARRRVLATRESSRAAAVVGAADRVGQPSPACLDTRDGCCASA